MASKSLILTIIFIFVLCIWVISIGTKGVHLRIVYDVIDQLTDKFDEVYPALKGCIALDSILIFLISIGIILTIKPFKTLVKLIFILILLSIVARTILGVVFLAGNDERGRKISKAYFDLDADQKSNQPRQIKTFVGAWVYEILALILGVPFTLIGNSIFSKL